MTLCRFLNEFQSEYKHSSRSRQHKNLRCFPACDPKGHSENTFCGTSLVVEFDHPPRTNGLLCAWGYISEADKDDNFKKGKIVSLRKLKSIEKSPGRMNSGILRGNITNVHGQFQRSYNDQTMRVSFNESLGAWTYEWSAQNRNLTSKIKHVFKILLCENNSDNPNDIIILDVFTSPEFRICSRTRTVKSTALEAGDTTSKKRSYDSISDEDHGAAPVAAIQASEIPAKRAKGMFQTIKEIALRPIKGFLGGGTDENVESKLVTMEENRIKDRLFGLINSVNPLFMPIRPGTNNEYPTGEEGFSQIENVLKNYAGMDEPFQLLKRVIVSVVDISTLDDDVGFIVAKYSSKEGMIALSRQCILEREERPEWSEEHEDEEFVDGDPHLIENSIFAMFRHASRKWITRALGMQNITCQQIAPLTEICWREGLIPFDPFIPPSKEIAEYLSTQIYGKIDRAAMSQYCTGAKVFISSSNQRAFARDILYWRRGFYRQILADLVRQNMLRSHTTLKSAEQVRKNSLNMNGGWVDIGLGVDSVSQVMRGVMGAVYGPLFSRAAKRMFSRMTVIQNANQMRFIGTPILLGTGDSIINLDGICHSIPNPYPVALLSAVFETRMPHRSLSYESPGHSALSLEPYFVFWYDPASEVSGTTVQQNFPDFYALNPNEKYYYHCMRIAKMPNKDTITFDVYDFLFPQQIENLDVRFTEHALLDYPHCLASQYQDMYTRAMVGVNEENMFVDLIE